MNREEIASLIYDKLNANKEELALHYEKTYDKIGYFFVDDLLPVDLVEKIYKRFPSKTHTVAKKSIREYKYIAYQMNEYDQLLEEVVFAFQDKKIVNLIGGICKKDDLEPDEHLYAGGLSLMGKDNFLKPHLDNSHDKDIERWRVFNLLYYVTPNWKNENGGNIELWPNGVTKKQITVTSKFNRLVVMATHNKSWHSVSKVLVDEERCCISNYYFSKTPIRVNDTFHVTTFRDKSNLFTDLVLQTDNFLRKLVRKLIKKGINNKSHQYKK